MFKRVMRWLWIAFLVHLVLVVLAGLIIAVTLGVILLTTESSENNPPEANVIATPTVETPSTPRPGQGYLEWLSEQSHTPTPTPAPGTWQACMDFADRWIPDRSARPDGWILFNDWCNRCQGPDNVSVQPVAPGSTQVKISCK